MGILKQLIKKYKKYKNPVKYYRRLGMKIGNKCELRSSNFGSEPYLITIGNHVRINAGVHFITHDGGTWVLRNNNKIENSSELTLFGRIIVKDNVHIGTNAIIMPGVTVGNNCIIGCGAIVTKDIPDNSVAAGVPARVIETIDEYIEKNKQKFSYTKSMNKEQLKKYLIEKYKID
ncbi:MAG: acyltransferase [Lachnospiraceae bacterium]|nr:acyltransferase [Lachnospiraceae bacterium]